MTQDITKLWAEFKLRQEAQYQKNMASKKMAVVEARFAERMSRWFFNPGLGEQVDHALRRHELSYFGMYGGKKPTIEDMLDWVADGKPGPKDIDADLVFTVTIEKTN